MKRIAFFLMAVLLGMFVFAQENNGTVYAEHETIEKTKAMWSAFVKGDKEAVMEFFADSTFVTLNGVNVSKKADVIKGWMNWWSGVTDFKVSDHKPAFPDAIDYKQGGMWVQDWLKFTGIHKKSGVVIDLPMHNLYSFNDEGKITSIHLYFNNDVMEQINNSLTTRENGTIYINHPHIVTVRKLLNAYIAKDIDTWKGFFAENAIFGNSTLQYGETMSLEERTEAVKKSFATDSKVKVEQVGYPDCMNYSQGDMWVVYSWWTVTRWNSEKEIKYPIMLSCTFNKEGKIVREYVFYSTNHFE